MGMKTTDKRGKHGGKPHRETVKQEATDGGEKFVAVDVDGDGDADAAVGQDGTIDVDGDGKADAKINRRELRKAAQSAKDAGKSLAGTVSKKAKALAGTVSEKGRRAAAGARDRARGAGRAFAEGSKDLAAEKKQKLQERHERRQERKQILKEAREEAKTEAVRELRDEYKQVAKERIKDRYREKLGLVERGRDRAEPRDRDREEFADDRREEREPAPQGVGMGFGGMMGFGPPADEDDRRELDDREDLRTVGAPNTNEAWEEFGREEEPEQPPAGGMGFGGMGFGVPEGMESFPTVGGGPLSQPAAVASDQADGSLAGPSGPVAFPEFGAGFEEAGRLVEENREGHFDLGLGRFQDPTSGQIQQGQPPPDYAAEANRFRGEEGRFKDRAADFYDEPAEVRRGSLLPPG